MRDVVRRHLGLLLLWMVIVAVVVVIGNVWHGAFIVGFFAGTFIAWLMATWVVGNLRTDLTEAELRERP
jgi:preprotein translocase subunit SecF